MLDSAQQFVIGVDGGGTGCRAAIGTRSNGIIAQAEAGRANATSAPELAIRNITKAINAAAAKAGIEVSALNGAVAHLGLAGVMTSADSQRIAVALPYEDIVVTDDRATAVAGALGGKDGYLLSVGTGTIIAASRSGTFNYVGGWGFHLADQGGGAWLGRAALKHVLMCHDGLASHSDLTRALFAEFQNDPNAIVDFSMSAKPGDYGTFAPIIVSSAYEGDVWGKEIMSRGGDYLQRGLNALGFQPGDTMCLSGGVGPHYAPFLPIETLSGRVKPRGTALDGAFQLARSTSHKRRNDR